MAVAISSIVVFEVAPAAARQGQAAQAKQPQWKDRAEYDLADAASKSQDPKKTLEILNSWKEKYPQTENLDLRFTLYVQTYQKLNDAKQLMQAARDWFAANQKSIQALYYINLLTPNPDTSADALDYGEKAARSLLALLNEVFAPEKKPQGTSEAEWKKGRMDMEGLAHRTLGWVAMSRKTYDPAETELTQYLKINPNDAEASYWLGSVIAAQKKPDTYPQALFQFARAACYTGPGSMDATRRKKMEDFVSKAYTAFHGQDSAGLQQLCSLASKQAFPPADFKILSSAEIAAHKEKELAERDPQLAFWLKLKEALTAPNGEQYFETGMKGALVPPEGSPPLKGRLIRQEPAKSPKELVLGLAEANTAEVTIKLDAPMTGRAEPGTVLEFRGVPTTFTKEPFMLTLDAEKKNVSGWPAPAATKKAPAKKGAVKKKK